MIILNPNTAFKEEDSSLILSSQYHVCWWLGDKRSQVIGRHDIDQVPQRVSEPT